MSGVVSDVVLGAFTELSPVERGDRWPRLIKLDDVVEAFLLHLVNFLHLHGRLRDGDGDRCCVVRRMVRASCLEGAL